LHGSDLPLVAIDIGAIPNAAPAAKGRPNTHLNDALARQPTSAIAYFGAFAKGTDAPKMALHWESLAATLTRLDGLGLSRNSGFWDTQN